MADCMLGFVGFRDEQIRSRMPEDSSQRPSSRSLAEEELTAARGRSRTAAEAGSYPLCSCRVEFRETHRRPGAPSHRSLASSQQSNLSKSTGHKSPQNSQKQYVPSPSTSFTVSCRLTLLALDFQALWEDAVRLPGREGRRAQCPQGRAYAHSGPFNGRLVRFIVI